MSNIFGGEGQEQHASEHEAGGADPITNLAALTANLDAGGYSLTNVGGMETNAATHQIRALPDFNTTWEVYSKLAANVAFRVWSDGVVEIPNGGLDALGDGPNGTGQLRFSNTRIYENVNGEIVVEDSAGNTTVIS